MKRTVYSFSGFLVILLMIITYLMVNGNYFKKKHAIPKDAHIEKKIDQILQKMSLDEKIGQMNQMSLPHALVTASMLPVTAQAMVTM